MPNPSPVNVTFFNTPADFRAWLEQYHQTAQELWVGYRKKGTGMPSITWPESVDEALCYGWIDGVRKSIDETCYCIRFTPRRPGSNWSLVNIKRVQELTETGRMQPAGLHAFAGRQEERSGIYTFEQERLKLDDALEEKFKANPTAWAFFQSQPPSYQRTMTGWVMSAKREETRLSRLEALMQDCAQGRQMEQFTRYRKKKQGAGE